MDIRKIIHVDMDAFYASIEQRDFPELKGKPVAVGYAAPRGVVAAASYEARRFGVHSAMPSMTALSKCPQLVFQPHRFDVYRKISEQIRDIFFQYTDLVEPLSLDEAYLDVTTDKKGIRSATNIALAIKKQIKEETNLTASAGVSYNKFLAKIASDVRKPDGIFVIEPHQAETFIRDLGIEKFHGIGHVTAEKLKEMGILKGSNLRALSLDEMMKTFGKRGLFFYDIVRGVDRRMVEPDRIRKSISVENTYEKDLITRFAIIAELYRLEKKLYAEMEELGQRARTVTIKIRFENFETITRSRTTQLIKDYQSLQHISRSLLEEIPLDHKGIRLMGIKVSNLSSIHDTEQLELGLNW